MHQQDEGNKFESSEVEELQGRLSSIRERHQKQRLSLFDNYQSLKTKARDIAIESARQCSSAASTARQSQNYDRVKHQDVSYFSLL